MSGQLQVEFCSCGNPVPRLALLARDPYCSTECARVAHGLLTERRTGTHDHLIRHGISRYRKGCKCETCLQAHRDHANRHRRRRRERNRKSAAA